MAFRGIGTRLIASLAVMMAGFLVSVAFLAGALGQLKVNGPLYQKIVAGKDLIADVLPPPDYIIESYLVVFELRESMGDAAQVRRLSAYLTGKLKSEYEDRHSHWVDDSLFLSDEPELRKEMLELSYEPARAFYEAVESSYLPAISAGDRALVDRTISGTLRPLYEEHRSHIDRVVALSAEKNARLERLAAELDRSKTLAAIALCSLAAVLGLALNLLMSRAVVSPLRQTAEMLKDISAGAGDLTRRLAVSTKDEIGELAGHFNATLERIQGLVSSALAEAERLETAGASLAETMGETAKSVGSIDGSVKLILGETGKQAASVEATGAAIGRISKGVRGMDPRIGAQAENVSQSSAAIEELLASSASVAKTLEDNALDINGLSAKSAAGVSELEAASSTMREIAKQSDALVDISAMIQSIAEQTNLLSMNAAIEAAHAGDSGRGFGVVAGEIRKLAESSGSQAKTVSAALTKIKQAMASISAATDALLVKFGDMDRSIKGIADREASIGRAMAEQAAASREILESIATLNRISQEIRAGSLEMLADSEDITREGESLTRVTSAVHGGVDDISREIGSIAQAVRAVEELSGENKKSIGALASELRKFKVR